MATSPVLAGDEIIFHRRYTDRFKSWYGEGINAEQIYINCGNNFVKFHAVFPAQAWLLERICRIYKTVDIALDAFEAKYVTISDADPAPIVVLSSKYKDNDPFAYFLDGELELAHRRIYAELISSLKTYKELDLTSSMFRELARSLLQVASIPERMALLDELTRQETFDTLSAIHVGASINIYTVRSAIMSKEAIFTKDVERIRAALAESEASSDSSSETTDNPTPISLTQTPQPPPVPVISNAEAGGSGSTYTVARSGQEWTVRRN